MEKKQPENKADAEKQRKAAQAQANANRAAIMEARMAEHDAKQADMAKRAAEARAVNQKNWLLPEEKKAQAKAAKVEAKAAKVEAKAAAKQPVVRDAKANKSMAKIRNDSGMKAVGGGGAKKAQEVKQDNSVRFKR